MRVIDLFCGCGGLSLGFQNAGMDIVAAFDNWTDALAVYRSNFRHPASKLDLSDIAQSVEVISPYNPDMIIGGPPCQDFSPAGKRNEDNGRGDLTVCFANIVSEIRPQWFVMENVERILKTQKLQDALTVFHAAGYGLTYTVLNSALCGVPQKRKRFVMIGKLGANDDFIKDFLLQNLADHEMSVAEYFGEKLPIKYYYRHPRSYVRRGIFSTSEPSATIRGVNRPMPKGYNLHPGDPVDSLDGIRSLTFRERSMIQTFPESFNFEGTKTAIEQMIGNAVPVNLGYYIADAIFRYSGEKRISKSHDITIKQLNLFDLYTQYANEPIIESCIVRENEERYGKVKKPLVASSSGNCLIGIVKREEDKEQLKYYCCSKFPSSIALNGLNYFMPYLEGKGIRDQYFIKSVHVDKKENSLDLLLVFELVFMKQVFDDYRPFSMNIWNSFAVIDR